MREEQSKSHICFVAPNAYPLIAGNYSEGVLGGAELQQVIVAKELVARGYRVSMVCSDFGQPDPVEIEGITIYGTCHMDSGLPIVRFLHPRLTSVWSALRRADAEIYYTRTASMLVGVVATFGRRNRKHTIFAAADNTDFSRVKTKIRFRRDLWIYEYGIRNSSKILAQNPAQKGLCQLNYGRDAEIIPNCCAISDDVSQRNGTTVLWVSTIRALKRPELLIELARQMPHRKFVMVGGADRYQTDLFKSISRSAKREANIDFVGFVPYSKIGAYFDGAKVVVNTSDTEGFPNTFLQAWAKSIPTVSFFDCQAWRGKDRIGYCVETLEDLVHVLDQLFSDELAYARAGELCRDYCNEHHSVRSVVDSLEAVIAQLCVTSDQ